MSRCTLRPQLLQFDEEHTATSPSIRRFRTRSEVRRTAKIGQESCAAGTASPDPADAHRTRWRSTGRIGQDICAAGTASPDPADAHRTRWCYNHSRKDPAAALAE